MCGFTGVFAYKDNALPVEQKELLRSRERMYTRGPDSAGFWISDDQRVGIAHQRLSIIDLSEAGAQPMLDHETGSCIVFNGEIYNYQVLRAELEAAGHLFRSHSDTEVLLKLYAVHGQEMLTKLRGMYAFAVWDKNREGVFLARDPFGIKPLYLADDGKTIRFASQVKALLAGGQVDTAPDPAGHVGFYLWGHVPEPFTLFRGVRALPAGTSLWIDRAGHKVRKPFFNLVEELVNASANGPITVEEAREQLRSALLDSVRHHLTADVPVGVLLSAGLDSSTLTGLAKEADVTELRTITLGFREFVGTENDEVPVAETIARHYASKHSTQWVRREDFVTCFDHLFDAMDQPTIDGVNSYLVCKAAHDAGLKVVLSGLGGDELFAGYSHFQSIPRMIRWLRHLNTLPGLGVAVRQLAAPILPRFTSPKAAGLLEYGGYCAGAYLLHRGLYMPWEIETLLDKDFTQEGWRDLQTLPALNQTLQGLKTDRARIAALEMRWYMRNQLLRDTDWASMAHSLEVRVPLVDIELFRAVNRLAAAGRPPGKSDMAAAPAQSLPDVVLNRDKTGFSVPTQSWLMGHQCQSATSGKQNLRGWARQVYDTYHQRSLFSEVHAVPMLSSSSEESSRRIGLLASEVATHDGIRSSILRMASLFSGALYELVTARYDFEFSSSSPSPRNILVFRNGQLGDTVVAVPALKVLRREFPRSHITMLTASNPGEGWVLASEVLPKGLIDEFITYDLPFSILKKITLCWKLRPRSFDLLAYLAPRSRQRLSIARDLFFFRLAGIQRSIGHREFGPLPFPKGSPSLPIIAHESEFLLQLLQSAGIGCGATVSELIGLDLGDKEKEYPRHWVSQIRSKYKGYTLIGIGPGSKWPSKCWPEDRFAEVVQRLIQEQNVVPVVFGGKSEAALAERLVARWDIGVNAAGGLSIRQAAAMLEQCSMFLGNDTGTMHLAAAVGTPCVAVFSAQDWPGRWYPFGARHIVFRKALPCEGCKLPKCADYDNACLSEINVDEVYEACRTVLVRQ